ncbi:SpoIIE family protein phosphatase [Streptomyces sp. Rer75]|uniref:SpoIIE family protein phosphatase n=1 Tax=Streptomyces sp. Rer75 TaxID=2750011 RepID=UPI0015CFE1D2|nr:SpoIIE family protein phosphatase [Streptomyces sp. Rer75]QLH25960.1 SpoIIE family protein phosphatase [Streptomyces sp. Rer75]
MIGKTPPTVRYQAPRSVVADARDALRGVPAPPAWLRWLPVLYVAAILAIEPVTPVQWLVSFLLIALPVVAAFTLGPALVGALGTALAAHRNGERAIIGDVRGKGLQAVRTVADVLGGFRRAAYEPGDLGQVCARLESRMAREAAEIPDDELFVTAALIEYDPLAHRVTVINHGRIEPVLISRGEVTTLSGPPNDDVAALAISPHGRQ